MVLPQLRCKSQLTHHRSDLRGTPPTLIKGDTAPRHHLPTSIVWFIIIDPAGTAGVDQNFMRIMA
jgi:hypothetical protein